MSENLEKVKGIISDHLGVDENFITEKTHIFNDLGADSLDIIAILMEIEHQFNVEIPDEDFENITTIGEIIKFIEDKK